MTSTLEIMHPDEVRTLCDDDFGLVQAAREGRTSAFEELVRRHESRMFRIAQNLLHSREDAQDAVQEAFFKAFQKLGQFQARSKFSTWLTRITVNEAMTRLRKESVYCCSIEDGFHNETEALPYEIASWSPNPEMLYSASELNRILEKNLRRLKPRLLAVFLLRDLEGLSLEETAQILGLTVAAVKTRTCRARLQLREWLNPCFRNGRRSATAATPEYKLGSAPDSQPLLPRPSAGSAPQKNA